MYDPDRTYLDVDFTGTPGYANGFNKFAKDCGARFDWEKRLFYITTNVCPMAALCVFPAISYARHLPLEITNYQRDRGMSPSLRPGGDHRGLVRPQRMTVPLVPFSRVRVVVGPGARDRVLRNRRTMSSVIIGMMTFMTCAVPAESSLSMTAHQHSASVFAAEVLPVAYLLLAAGALALTVFMLQRHERFRHRFESHEIFRLRMRLDRTPTEREITAELRRLERLRYTRERGFSPESSRSVSPVTPDASDASDNEQAPPTPDYVQGPNTFTDRVDNPMPEHLQLEFVARHRRHAMSIVGPTINVNDIAAARAHPTNAMPVPAPLSPATVARQFQQAAADALDVIAEVGPRVLHPVTYLPLRPTIHAGVRTCWTSSRNSPANADRVNAVPAPTPRSLRYSRRSAHLQLALLMCCVGEVQSSAVAFSTRALAPLLHCTVLSP
jgi:hypothetical protein